MKYYKTKCMYGYAILGESPPKLDAAANYIIVNHSKFFPHCVMIRRADGKSFFNENTWIVPASSMY